MVRLYRRCPTTRRAAFVAAVLIGIIPSAHSANLESGIEGAPLPLPSAIYGNPNGCLILHGDAAEAPALWISPYEIGGVDFICKVGRWQRDTNGVMSAECERRRFLILPQNANVQHWLFVVELLGHQTYSSYQLAQCGPE
jgi:hypothetical protein